MGVKFSNNGHSTLAASLASNGTSITVASGHGARFPSLSSGEFFYATLIDASNNLEIVKVTARSSDVLTATRAQESTTARAYAIGDRIELRVTAAGIADATNIDNIVPSQSGNSGKFLKTDGTNVSFAAVTQAFGLQSQQVFTSSGTYTKPSGINTIKVYVTGGGGGGGGHGASSDMGSGGGAGGTAIEIIDVSSLSSTVAVTIGSGGAGASGSSNGSAGGTSSFGSYCSATGGGGGDHGNNGAGVGGNGGVGSGGDINITGGTGGPGWDNFNVTSTYARGFGYGGPSYWGGGGRGSSYSTVAAQAGQAYGSGGGAPHSTHGGTAGAGKIGIIVVEEYI